MMLVPAIVTIAFNLAVPVVPAPDGPIVPHVSGNSSLAYSASSSLPLPRAIAFALPIVPPLEATSGTSYSAPSSDATDSVPPPHGFSVMCREDATLCHALAAGNPSAPTVDADAQWNLLREVNANVNRRVRQETDLQTTGREDVWRRPGTGRDAAGDCEDLAIEKRLELIAQGFPAGDLYFAVGYRSTIGLHAVLIAHTQRGEIVLDSRTSAMVRWKRAPYTWVSRQSAVAPSQWMSAVPLRQATPVELAMLQFGATAATAD